MRLLGLLFCVGLAACGDPGHPGEPAPERTAPPVMVYSSYADATYLPGLLQDFTEATGIPVVVRHRTDAENLADMAAKSGSQPADVLLTGSVWAIRQAADEGLLRPLPAGSRGLDVAAPLRDPDDLWTALSAHRVVVYHAPDIEAPDRYTALADDRYRAAVCLATSDLPQHRLLLAHLIDDLGERDTELAVRGWVANLAIPPLANDEEVVAAIDAGRCRVGLVSSRSVTPPAGGSVGEVDVPAFDIEGIGIGRHAQSPDDAAALIDWLLGDAVQARHGREVRSFPVRGGAPFPAGRDITAAAYRYEDAVRLAERAGYW